MHNTQSRLPVNDNDVVTSIATIGTFEAVVFFHGTVPVLWLLNSSVPISPTIPFGKAKVSGFQSHKNNTL